jgi:hypothetical protein
MSKLSYHEAAAAMQAGVALAQQIDGETPKSLRVGINAALIEVSVLSAMLIARGLFTEAEYAEALADGMRREVASYERDLSERTGMNVTLGYSATDGRGCVTIEPREAASGEKKS